jgi:hypothetical protein
MQSSFGASRFHEYNMILACSDVNSLKIKRGYARGGFSIASRGGSSSAWPRSAPIAVLTLFFGPKIPKRDLC